MMRATLRRSLGHALKWGLVTRNVATLVDPPGIEQKPLEPLTAEDVPRLLDVTRSVRFGPLFHVAIATGLRQGERLGLKWEDADLAAGTVRIRRQLQRIYGENRLVPLKAALARRTVPLTALAVAAQREQKDRQAFERARLGEHWRESGLVFAASIGTPLDRNNMRRRFRSILADADLPRQRFRDLRRGRVSLMIQ